MGISPPCRAFPTFVASLVGGVAYIKQLGQCQCQCNVVSFWVCVQGLAVKMAHSRMSGERRVDAMLLLSLFFLGFLCFSLGFFVFPWVSLFSPGFLCFPWVSLQSLVVKMAHSKISGERRVEEAVAEVSAVTGENVVVRRALGWRCAGTRAAWARTCTGGQEGGGAGENGGVGGAVARGGGGQEGLGERVREGGRDLAMHVVALRPQFLSRDGVPQGVVQNERDILTAQVSGAPRGPISPGEGERGLPGSTGEGVR